MESNSSTASRSPSSKTEEELLVCFTIYKLSPCFRGSTLEEGEGVREKLKPTLLTLNPKIVF